MKAVGFQQPGPIERLDALQDITLEKPLAHGRDLLVEIKAVSVNPVDTKVRVNRQPKTDSWEILGYDAVGVVNAIGPEVEYFKVGDEVFYAGVINRPGTNSEFHLVDERIVGRKPANLSDSEAAALPLTAITAWEMLFDRLEVQRPTVEGGKLILVIGGAGGVGSITLQLLRAMTDLTIIATASRQDTKQWVMDSGAHHVIDHSQPLAPQVESLGLGKPGFVFSTTQTDRHYSDIVELIAPQGRFGLIDDPLTLDAKPLKMKSISLHWELMFTRPVFSTPDLDEQRTLLNQVADLVEAEEIRSTATEVAGKINAANLKTIHAQLESKTTRGKIVLEGF